MSKKVITITAIVASVFIIGLTADVAKSPATAADTQLYAGARPPKPRQPADTQQYAAAKPKPPRQPADTQLYAGVKPKPPRA